MGAKPKITKAIFKKVLNKSGGLIASIAKSCSVDRMTVYRFLKRFPDMQDLLDDQVQAVADIAENHIIKKVNKGDYKACVFYLQHKAKDRGYANSLELKEPEKTNEDPLRERMEKMRKAKAKKAEEAKGRIPESHPQDGGAYTGM